MKTKITLTIALLAALASLYQGRKAYAELEQKHALLEYVYTTNTAHDIGMGYDAAAYDACMDSAEDTDCSEAGAQ